MDCQQLAKLDNLPSYETLDAATVRRCVKKKQAVRDEIWTWIRDGSIDTCEQIVADPDISPQFFYTFRRGDRLYCDDIRKFYKSFRIFERYRGTPRILYHTHGEIDQEEYAQFVRYYNFVSCIMGEMDEEASEENVQSLLSVLNTVDSNFNTGYFLKANEWQFEQFLLETDMFIPEEGDLDTRKMEFLRFVLTLANQDTALETLASYQNILTWIDPREILADVNLHGFNIEDIFEEELEMLVMFLDGHQLFAIEDFDTCLWEAIQLAGKTKKSGEISPAMRAQLRRLGLNPNPPNRFVTRFDKFFQNRFFIHPCHEFQLEYNDIIDAGRAQRAQFDNHLDHSQFQPDQLYKIVFAWNNLTGDGLDQCSEWSAREKLPTMSLLKEIDANQFDNWLEEINNYPDKLVEFEKFLQLETHPDEVNVKFGVLFHLLGPTARQDTDRFHQVWRKIRIHDASNVVLDLTPQDFTMFYNCVATMDTVFLHLDKKFGVTDLKFKMTDYIGSRRLAFRPYLLTLLGMFTFVNRSPPFLFLVRSNMLDEVVIFFDTLQVPLAFITHMNHWTHSEMIVRLMKSITFHQQDKRVLLRFLWQAVFKLVRNETIQADMPRDVAPIVLVQRAVALGWIHPKFVNLYEDETPAVQLQFVALVVRVKGTMAIQALINHN